MPRCRYDWPNVAWYSVPYLIGFEACVLLTFGFGDDGAPSLIQVGNISLLGIITVPASSDNSMDQMVMI